MNHDRRDYSSSRHHRRGGGRRGRWRGGGGGGGPRRSGNRFLAENNRDPHAEMISTLQTMLTGFSFQDPDRMKNAEMMASVVCGSNVELFLGCTPDEEQNVVQKFSPMVVQLVHCVAVWPTETPLYAALTLLIHEKQAETLQGDTTTSTKKEAATFAHRCLTYALLLLCRDFDLALLDSDATALLRCRYLLTYIVLAAQLGMGVRLHNTNDDDDDDDHHHQQDALIVPAAIQATPLPSVTALLQALVIAAQQAETRRLPMAYSICLVLLDTLPYLTSMDTAWKQHHIVEPIAEIVARSYQSQFEPGLGRHAILLQNPVLEQGVDGEDEEDDDDDDEEEDEEEAPICDSFQDALRSLQAQLEGTNPTQLATFTDTPWTQLLSSPPPPAPETMGDDTEDGGGATQTPLQFTSNAEQRVELQIFPNCKSITALLTNSTTITLSKHPSLGIMGRFPVFGPPGTDDDDEEEEDDEKEDGMDETTTTVDPRLKSYQDNYKEADRYFCGELIRGVLFTQHSSVSDTGIERGDVKQTAERIWGVRHMHPSDGVEYCILETLLTVLLVEEQQHSVYVSRVILELTKLEPKLFSAAILIAVSNIYEDYMPSFTPRSRSAVASWLAFHLTHTDYQWPTAYWKHWETASGVRAVFCSELLFFLTQFVSSNETLLEECLPETCSLRSQVPVASSTNMLEEEPEFLVDLRSRIESRADPTNLLEHLQASEEPNKLGVLIKAIITPESNDMLGAFNKKVEHYRSVLSGLMADDDMGERRILQAIEQTVDSRSMLTGTLQTFVCNGIVSTMSVLDWLLDTDRSELLDRWWEVAVLALQLGLASTVWGSAQGDNATDSLAFLDPLLASALRNVSALVAASNEQAQGKRIPAAHIEVVEGFKYLLCGAESLFLSIACVGDATNNQPSLASLQDMWIESTVCGPQLVSLLDVGGLPAIDLLRGVLERL